MRNAWIVFSLLFVGACGGGAATGGARAPATEATPSAVPAGPTPTAEPMLDATQAQASFDSAETAFAAAGSDCAQLCKALSSMTRATERLCELAKEGGDDKRCTDATSKLDAARTKVKSSCGGCE